MKPAVPANEAQRLDALYQLKILDSEAEQDFDQIAQLAALICQTPSAYVSLIDIDRQWFKARFNLETRQTSRTDSICSFTILTPQQLTYIPDTLQDPRFNGHAITKAAAPIRFYAGAPLRLEPNLAVGSLCVFDLVPRELTSEQLQALALLAEQVVTLLKHRLVALASEQQQHTLSTIMANVPVLLGQIDAQLRFIFCNQKYRQWFQLEPLALIGQSLFEVMDEATADRFRPFLQQALQGESVEFIHHKSLSLILKTGLVPQLDAQGTVTHIIIIASDVTEQHEQQNKIQRERDRMDAIILGTNLGTWEWHVQTGKTIYNDRWYNILGLPSQQETDVRLWRSLMHPQDKAKAENLLQQHFTGQLSFYDARFRMRHVQGHWVWIHAVGKVMSWDQQGQPLLMFGTHTDISADMAREHEMRSTRSWLQAIVDSSTEVALISTDQAGVIQLFNTGAERMLGYSASELVGRHSPAFFHDVVEVQRRSEQLSAEYHQPIEGFDTFVYKARIGVSETRQWTFICKNGDRKQVRLSVSVMRDQNKQVLGYLGVAIDITQLEQLNHALLLSEQRHRSMLENLPGVVYRCINDEHWTMLFISDEVEKLTGYPAKQFIRNKAVSFEKITFAEDRLANRLAVEAQLEKHARFSVEYRIRHANGQLRWVQELGRGIFDQQNRLLFIDGFIWDITAQKAARLELRASEQKLSSLYQLAPLAIVLSSFPQGIVLEANPALQQMLGFQPEQLSGVELTELIPPTYHTLCQQQLAALEHQGRFGPDELEFVHQLGHKVPVIQSGILIEGLQGERQIWSIIQDITEHKRIEQMKNQFVSMVSHELRTPLTAISGALGLIGGGALGPVPDTLQNMLTIALENSHKLSQLINDLLDIDKLVAGKMQFRFVRSSMLELLQQTVLHNQPYADKYQTKIELQVASEAINVEVELDPMRFHQVMANLLSNAAKFAPECSLINVRLMLSGQEVQIAVQDQGPGISKEFQLRMFEKFSQADSADARSKEGTGLGLAIVKELTERMNGWISFDTELGKGTCFYLHFPVYQARKLMH
jgi:PAS domain S-box-containing protein